MAIVIYKCDTCKREIELQRNIRGLEHVGRCNITQGCRGKLYQKKLLQDHIRGDLPDPVSGLDDWRQRKILHNHIQPIERDEWIIKHGLGVVPVVSVYGDRPIENDPDNQVEVTPVDIVVVDIDTIKLVFDRPWSGAAQLIGRQSNSNLLRSIEAVETAPAIQMSIGGELTIATKQSSPIVNISIDFSTPSGTVNVVYAVDDQPALVSPWSGERYDHVIIRGNVYSVRSFNMIVPDMTTGVIVSGSTFQIVGYDDDNDETFDPLIKNEMLVLLAAEPYDDTDKITDKIIDAYSVSASQNPFGFYYDNGEVYAEQAVAQKIYPFIRSV
jgi:hypothetical protein